MERTEIFALNTAEDVKEFAEYLIRTKGLAPVSLKFTVALTLCRQVQVKEIFDEAEAKIGNIGAGFNRLVKVG